MNSLSNDLGNIVLVALAIYVLFKVARCFPRRAGAERGRSPVCRPLSRAEARLVAEGIRAGWEAQGGTHKWQ